MGQMLNTGVELLLGQDSAVGTCSPYSLRGVQHSRPGLTSGSLFREYETSRVTWRAFSLLLTGSGESSISMVSMHHHQYLAWRLVSTVAPGTKAKLIKY